MSDLKTSVAASNSSRRTTYVSLNPDFTVHELYVTRMFFNDLYRTSFTRLRVCGHNLAVETGRWNRRGRGRLPLEERLCPCGEVQTELHVVESCVLTQPLREHHRFTSWHELMAKDARDAARIVHLLLSTYQ